MNLFWMTVIALMPASLMVLRAVAPQPRRAVVRAGR